MPRPPRVELAGSINHVTARVVGQTMFRDDMDRRRYLHLFSRVARRKWRCLGYCLMDNHIHLLVETPQPNLSTGMQRLHGEYAQTFNRRHKRTGHLFEERFHNVVVLDDAHLWTLLRYIAANPVKAGLCTSPEQWLWSSHAAILSGTSPPWLDERRLLSFVGADGGNPRDRYADLLKGV